MGGKERMSEGDMEGQGEGREGVGGGRLIEEEWVGGCS